MKKKCSKKKYNISFGQNGLDNLPQKDPKNMDLMDFLVESFNKRYDTNTFDPNSFTYQTTPKREISFDDQGRRILDPLYEYNIGENLRGKSNARGERQDIEFSSLRYFGDKVDPNDPNKIQSIYDVDEIKTTYGPRGENKYSKAINPLIDFATFGANSITDMKQRRNQMRKRTELMQGKGSYNLNEYGLNKPPAYFQTGGYAKFQNAGTNDPKEVKQKENPTKILLSDWDGDYFMQRYEVADPRFVWKQDEGGAQEKAGEKTLQFLLNKLTPEQQQEAFKTLKFTGDKNSDYFVEELPTGEVETKYRRIDMFNADGTVKDAFARARESKNRERTVTGGGFIDGSAGDNGFVDLAGLLIDRSVELPTYNRLPSKPAPTKPKPPVQNKPVAPKPAPTKPAPQPPAKPAPVLPRFPAVTRDNTMTQANEFRGADGTPFAREIQKGIQADIQRNKRVSKDILLPIYNEDGSIKEYQLAQDWNGLYEQDYLNWGQSPANKGNPDEEREVLMFVAATLATRGMASLPMLMTRLGSMGIKGKRALDLINKGKEASKLVKKPEVLNPEVIVPKPAGLLNKGKTVIDIKPVAPKQLPPSRVPPSRRLPDAQPQQQFSIDPRQLPQRPGSPQNALPYTSNNPSGYVVPRLGVGFQQGGYNLGEEIDLSPEEVAKLIELGYDFEVV
ncbi:hypothetical protein [Leptolyngbya phage Lbo-JY46]